MDAIHTEEYKDYTIEIYYDEVPINPREDSYFSKMICFHKRYTLGDKHDLTSDQFNNWEEMEKYLIKEKKAFIIMPLHLYDHSGISMKTFSHGVHANWDCGQVGFIYVTKEDIKKEYNIKTISKKLKEKVIDRLKLNVEYYSQYLEGNCYGFKILKENKCEACEHEDFEEIDSCWGYIGDYDELIIEAKRSIDNMIKEKSKETIKQ